MTELEIGKTYEVKYPFIRCEYSNWNEDGPYTELSWQPGVYWQMCDPDDSDAIAHSEGKMFLTVEDIYKPGRFPARVFYTRKFQDPDGKMFGKGKLHIGIVPKFKRLISGYSVEYEIVEYESPEPDPLKENM